MMQVIEQTRDEKIAMYMKCTKREIILMLLENQKIVERASGVIFIPLNETLKPPYTIS